MNIQQLIKAAEQAADYLDAQLEADANFKNLNYGRYEGLRPLPNRTEIVEALRDAIKTS